MRLTLMAGKTREAGVVLKNSVLQDAYLDKMANLCEYEEFALQTCYPRDVIFVKDLCSAARK